MSSLFKYYKSPLSIVLKSYRHIVPQSKVYKYALRSLMMRIQCISFITG